MRCALLALVVLTSCRASTTPPLRVAMASDLAPAFERIAADFTARTGVAVSLVPGSTGLLARQLEEGAPYDVFAAADVATVEGLVQRGRCAGRVGFARGRLVVLAAPGQSAPESLAQWASTGRVAIANPEHAPYGRAAMEVLRSASVPPQLRDQLVLAQNVRQAFELANSGNAALALTARALVNDVEASRWRLVDATLHTPLEQAIAACSKSADAQRFIEAVRSNAGRSTLAGFGFELPEATP